MDGYGWNEHTRSVGGGFGGGRCGGAAPAQGRALAPDRPELQWSVVGGQWLVKVAFARLVRGGESIAAE